MTFQEKYAKKREEAQKALQDVNQHTLLELYANITFDLACEAIDEDLNRAYDLKRIRHRQVAKIRDEFFCRIEFNYAYVHVGDNIRLKAFPDLFYHHDQIVEILDDKFASVGLKLTRTKGNWDFEEFYVYLKFDSNDNNTDS